MPCTPTVLWNDLTATWNDLQVDWDGCDHRTPTTTQVGGGKTMEDELDEFILMQDEEILLLI